MDTKRIGNSTELNCIAYLYNCGCEILLPYGDSQKYDIVIEYNKQFYKIQCKNANAKYKEDGTIDYISFKTCWESGRKTRTKKRYSKEEVDFFATYYEGQCYLIPVEECSTVKRIRFSSPNNHQGKDISFAKDYIGKDILNKLL